MSRVIIFCGQSGSGKTTLALEVSQQFNIFLLSKDALKERLYELERKKRIEMRPRHYSHHDVTRKVLGHFVKDNFDYSTFPGNKLFLDTSQPLEKLVEQTLEFLRTERK